MHETHRAWAKLVKGTAEEEVRAHACGEDSLCLDSMKQETEGCEGREGGREGVREEKGGVKGEIWLV